jgi:hypothetical protein
VKCMLLSELPVKTMMDSSNLMHLTQYCSK